jgi:hypothetical protein
MGVAPGRHLRIEPRAADIAVGEWFNRFGRSTLEQTHRRSAAVRVTLGPVSLAAFGDSRTIELRKPQ